MDTSFIQYNSSFLDYAKDNRKHQTNSESLFREQVKNRKFYWYKFKRQKVIWSFILDFYCSELLLWIEIDWRYHLKRQDYDKVRDSEIKHKWIKVIRFKNEEIENNLKWVLEELNEIIKNRF